MIFGKKKRFLMCLQNKSDDNTEAFNVIIRVKVLFKAAKDDVLVDHKKY